MAGHPQPTSLPPRPPEIHAQDDIVEMAWRIISNAGGGDWKKESPEWQVAAETFREKYHTHLRLEREIQGNRLEWEMSPAAIAARCALPMGIAFAYFEAMKECQQVFNNAKALGKVEVKLSRRSLYVIMSGTAAVLGLQNLVGLDPKKV